MAKDYEQLTFSATLYKIQTEASGGWRIILDAPETDSEAIVQLSKLRSQLLCVAVVTDLREKK